MTGIHAARAILRLGAGRVSARKRAWCALSRTCRIARRRIFSPRTLPGVPFGLPPRLVWASGSGGADLPSARWRRSRRWRLKPSWRPPGTHASMRSTTILAVRRDGKLAIAGDGQVTLDKTIVKHGARKVRKVSRRQGFGRLRRFGRRRHHAAREVRGEVRRVQGSDASRRRAGEGLAPGSRSAPFGGAHDRRQRRASVLAFRDGRRHRARRRDRRDRQRRTLTRKPRPPPCCATRSSMRRRLRARGSRSLRRSASTPIATLPWRLFRDQHPPANSTRLS